MPSVLQFVPIVLGQNFGPQVLARTPEPDHQVVTDAEESVANYDQVMETKLAISYAIATEAIYRTRKSPTSRALDVACGPGHLTLNMARDLEIGEMIGIDLSQTMVYTASKNAREQRADAVQFQEGDATKLDFDDQAFDLCTMMDAAHHLPTPETLTKALTEMDRVTKPDGHIVLMDLVRLRTDDVTRKYVQLVGQEYEDLGLADFFNQFRDSMYAAWTPTELMSAIPLKTQRKWISLVPRGLPYAQFLFGIPAGQSSLFERKGAPWQSSPVRDSDTKEYQLARLGLGFCRQTEIDRTPTGPSLSTHR
ncbi:putative methyltransferase YcgJ [Stieleria neptunia]|uniref:Putative methyltransferase YcgJ n=1 Tax=Stieleria neptunia TaxID=2527979 RepID=A0A518HQX4_9BACT|nr:class I SAM-dependent methyltransferase [Stieleria neptunia]QDV43266.1 putative methyltransferase YcgJ [Stieleria neptunia]